MATGRDGVLDPLAPRPDVGDRVDPRALEGERHLSSGDPGPAHGAHRGVPVDADRGGPAPDLLRGQERTVVGEHLGHREVDGARDVAGDPVDGLARPAVALRGPYVEEHPGASHLGRAPGIQHWDRPRPHRDRPRCGPGHVRSHGEARAPPRREPAVEHPHRRVPRPAQHPPGPGRAQGGLLVVDDELVTVVDAAGAQGRLEDGGVRQRVPPEDAGRPGECRVEVEVRGARDVLRGIQLGARCPAEVVLDVEHPHLPAGQEGGEVVGGDEGAHPAIQPPAADRPRPE